MKAVLRSVSRFGWSLVLVHFAIALVYSVAIPLLRGPDETEHLDAISFAVSEIGFPSPHETLTYENASLTIEAQMGPGGLPRVGLSTNDIQAQTDRSPSAWLDQARVLGGNQMSQHPPLYYTVIGAVSRVLFMGIPTSQIDWGLEIWIYRLLTALTVPLVSLLVGLAATRATRALLRLQHLRSDNEEELTGPLIVSQHEDRVSNSAFLLAVAISGAHSMRILVSSVVSNDAFVLLSGAGFIYSLASFVNSYAQKPRDSKGLAPNLPTKYLKAMAGWTAFGMLSKNTSYPLVLLFALISGYLIIVRLKSGQGRYALGPLGANAGRLKLFKCNRRNGLKSLLKLVRLALPIVLLGLVFTSWHSYYFLAGAFEKTSESHLEEPARWESTFDLFLRFFSWWEPFIMTNFWGKDLLTFAQLPYTFALTMTVAVVSSLIILLIFPQTRLITLAFSGVLFASTMVLMLLNYRSFLIVMDGTARAVHGRYLFVLSPGLYVAFAVAMVVVVFQFWNPWSRLTILRPRLLKFSCLILSIAPNIMLLASILKWNYRENDSSIMSVGSPIFGLKTAAEIGPSKTLSYVIYFAFVFSSLWALKCAADAESQSSNLNLTTPNDSGRER